MDTNNAVISAFQAAAQQVPAYQNILKDEGADPHAVKTIDDFQKLVPIIDKQKTFGSFGVAELCRNGQLGPLAGVLTSSGHSGLFAFGIYDLASTQGESDRIDDALDLLLQVRSKTTLLINCLPMGVQVPTRACTTGITSVRPDMVTALVKQFGPHYEQIILVGETAFIKNVLEEGRDKLGIDWKNLLVHIIVGEEPLAENARKYLENLLGSDINRPETGLIGSSMGVAEVGLNLFSEIPPLAILRRKLHENTMLRKMLFGSSATCVPMIFTYDPQRIFVEVLKNGELVLTTLDPSRPLPLIRYRTGDIATVLNSKKIAKYMPTPQLKELFRSLSLLAISGRGEAVSAGKISVYPEEIKEGIYHDPALAQLTTANFRLRSGPRHALLRIQLCPGITSEPDLPEKFAHAISPYTKAKLEIMCQPYETFVGGMTLDYERKFAYIEK